MSGSPRGSISFWSVIATFLFSVLNLLDHQENHQTQPVWCFRTYLWNLDCSLGTSTKNVGITHPTGQAFKSVVDLGCGKHLWDASEILRVC